MLKNEIIYDLASCSCLTKTDIEAYFPLKNEIIVTSGKDWDLFFTYQNDLKIIENGIKF